MELTTSEAAKRLGVTPGRVRQWVTEGKIKPRYLTNRMMVIDEKELAKIPKVRKPGRKPKGKKVRK